MYLVNGPCNPPYPGHPLLGPPGGGGQRRGEQRGAWGTGSRGGGALNMERMLVHRHLQLTPTAVTPKGEIQGDLAWADPGIVERVCVVGAVHYQLRLQCYYLVPPSPTLFLQIMEGHIYYIVKGEFLS